MVWLRYVVENIGHPECDETNIRQENLGAIYWTAEVQGLRKVRNIGLRYQFVRKNVEEGRLKVIYTPSADNRAD